MESERRLVPIHKLIPVGSTVELTKNTFSLSRLKITSGIEQCSLGITEWAYRAVDIRDPSIIYYLAPRYIEKILPNRIKLR